MSIETILMKALGGPLAKFLLKTYLSEPIELVGEGLLDVAQRRITDYGDQREAQRQFERLGERIVKRLLPLFEQETRNTDISVPAVAAELAETLGGRISADFFLARDLDPAQVTIALRAARPVNTGYFSDAEITLYNRALDESIRYVVQVASRLPRFEETYAAVSLQRLNRMSEALEEVLDTTRRIEQTVAEMAAQNTDADERFARYEADYRQAVIRNLNYLELFGVDTNPESRRHALSVAYISLNLKQSVINENETGSLAVETVLDSLSPAAGRLLIRGEAGSGKSTLFRWTAREAASLELVGPLAASEVAVLVAMLAIAVSTKASTTIAGEGMKIPAADEREREYWRFRIPFLLRLRDCKDGQLPSPDDFPSHIAKEIGTPPHDWVTSILRRGKAIVLLDGIDEVPNVHREQLRRGIEGIVGAYPENYYVVSTRPAAVDEGWLAAADFREAAVDPMSDVDRALFIEKWHEAVERELALLGKPDPTLPQIACALIEQLREHLSVARLATNPLLCAMICALHRERSHKLPESQAELCEAICQMLLHRRERESGLSVDVFPSADRGLTYLEKRAIVQDIAHYMVRNGESAILWSRARQSVQETLRNFSERQGIDADELLKWLIERGGVLREPRPGHIDFIHNTLKEYLAAERFVDADDAGQLSDRYSDASWQPVILFSVATNRREFATKIVQRILGSHGGDQLSPEELRARRLFALRCRTAALHLSPELITELDSIEGSLFPPRSMADAEALASGGDAAVDYLRSRESLNDSEAAACVRTLRLIGTHKAHMTLRSYLQDRRTTVVSELAQTLNPLEIEVVRYELQRSGEIPLEFRAQIADLSPLHTLNLVRLNLRNTRVSDLAPLIGLTGLKLLDLSDTLVSALAPLAGLTRLQSLSVAGTRINSLVPLAGLAGLRSLKLSTTQVSDTEPLTKLVSLQALNLSETRVRDIAPLAKLTGLQYLNIESTQVRDLSPLVHLDLRYLCISGDVDTSILCEKTSLTILRK